MHNVHINGSFEAYKIIILVLEELQSVPVDEFDRHEWGVSFISDAQAPTDVRKQVLFN